MRKIKNQSLKIKNLRVTAGGKEIIKSLTLEIGPGEIHALMGPNGSGKSSLAYALAGHPHYSVAGGEIFLGETDLTGLKPEGRSRAGLFLAFQYPVGVAGVSLFNFLKTARGSRRQKVTPLALLTELKVLSAEVGLEEDFLKRDLNLDFSGGEKKRAEVLQALALRPKFAVFDEADSGLDLDALKMIAKKIRSLAEGGTGVLVITHYQRILSYLRPHFVHVLIGGQIVESGGGELAEKLEKEGYHRYA